MLSRTSYLLCLLLAACAHAAKPLGLEVCGASCYYTLAKTKFASDNVTEQTLCTHPLRVTSTYLCIWEHCQEKDLAPGINWWAGTCKKSAKVVNLAAYKSTVANVTQEYIDSLPTVQQTQKTVVDVVSMPSQANWDISFRTVNTYYQNIVYHQKLRYVLLRNLSSSPSSNRSLTLDGSHTAIGDWCCFWPQSATLSHCSR